MKQSLVRGLRLSALLAFLGSSAVFTPAASTPNRADSAPAGWRTVEISRTNSSTRVITNLIEVTVPKNVFVTEYRTNWVERTLTNVLESFVTNWSTRDLTNTITLYRVRTNVMDHYVTNWTTLTLTNTITHTLTNWETIVVTKTNWIKQPITQVFEINVPAPTVPAAVTETAAAVTPAAVAADTLVLDAVKTSRLVGDGQIEVKFRVQLAGDGAATLQVPQWRVERDDGAVLFFAQSQEFTRALPSGRYRVEVKASRFADSPLLALRTTLEVTRDTVARR